MVKLIELGIMKDAQSAPSGFSRITMEQLHLNLKESESNESLIAG